MIILENILLTTLAKHGRATLGPSLNFAVPARNANRGRRCRKHFRGSQLEVNRPVTVNVTLQVGATTQTLTVSSVAEQVNVRSQTISYEVTRQMVTELPLNGRNILQLMQLAPDTGPVASSSYQQPASRPENTST